MLIIINYTILNYQFFFNSILPILARCTSSGPSANRSILAHAKNSAKGTSDDSPFAP